MILDAKTGAVRYRLATTPVNQIKFSPDGDLLVTSSNEGTARVWDARDGDLLHVLGGHTSPVLGLDFSPDGHVLATTSTDSTIKLWSVSDLDSIPLTLSGHVGAVYDVQFSPDGKRLITGSRDMTARVWALDVGDLTKIARERVTRGLTTSECRQYLHVQTCPRSAKSGR